MEYRNTGVQAFHRAGRCGRHVAGWEMDESVNIFSTIITEIDD